MGKKTKRAEAEEMAAGMSDECDKLTSKLLAALQGSPLDVGVSVMATLLANALATAPEEVGEAVLRGMRLIMASPPEEGRWN